MEEYIVTLEDTLTDWLPKEVTANVPNSDQITIRQLLNHTSGIAEYDAILIRQAFSNPDIFLQDWQPEQIFDPTEDMIGLVESELTFDEIAIADGDRGAMISVIETGETLAILQGVYSSELIPGLFAVTPDISLI